MIFILMIAALIIGYGISWFLQWNTGYCAGDTKIIFDDFREYYDLSPGNFELKDDYVIFSGFKENDPYHSIKLYFSFIDLKRYHKFRKTIVSNKAILNERKHQEEFLNAIHDLQRKGVG